MALRPAVSARFALDNFDCIEVLNSHQTQRKFKFATH